MKDQFNIYHFFAGAFVPSWLLSRTEISAGAKLTYSLLAQQANSSGATQLNFQMLEHALGASEGQLARHLMELEDVQLVHTQRGNINTEDIRIFFPCHVWMTGLDRTSQANPTLSDAHHSHAQTPAGNRNSASRQSPAQRPLLADVEPGPKRRSKRSKRWSGPPRSKHPFETCLGFVTYQKEVLGHDNIWNAKGLARAIHQDGDQDTEIDYWLSAQQSQDHAA